MIYEKRYLQFNSLVFDGYDMISDFDEDISFKDNVQEYSYGHGGYMPFKSDYMYAETKSANMTITIRLNKVPCEYRKFYLQFVEEELSKAGKLWAVKNNEIIWTNAYVKNRTPVITNRQDYVEWDVEFVIPSGIWNKADKQKTFLVPYDPCTMMECKGYMEVNPCQNESCTDCCQECIDAKAEEIVNRIDCTCCCEGALTQDMQLCYHLKEIETLYGCERQYQLVYDCESANKFTKERFIGQKLCAKTCDNMIAGRFYSETDLPTTDVTIVLDGNMNNPEITINGVKNIIQGEYNGTLTITPSGDIYYSDGCCDEILDPKVWVIPNPTENRYGWTVYPRMNSLIVNLNTCCADEHLNCVYVQAQGITA